jgi:hypothetical protein
VAKGPYNNHIGNSIFCQNKKENESAKPMNKKEKKRKEKKRNGK